jgi:DNA repair exonuclease SbcCD ATPase subunit
MKITAVSATNFKGRTFEYQLPDLVQVVGKNFSGKTSIVDAIRLACMGNIPELGKTNQATWQLSSGPVMSVGIALNGGGNIGPSWERTYSLKGDTVTERSQGTNDMPKLDAVPLLNAAAYFAMTDSERIRYVFERAELPQDFTAAGIITLLKKINFDDHSEVLEETLAEVVEGVCREPLEQDVNAGLSALTDTKKGKLATDYTFHNRRAKETIGTTRVLTELKNREGECSAEVLADIETSLVTKRREMQEASQRLGGLEEQARAAEKGRQRRADITAALAAPLFDPSGRIAAIGACLKKLRKQTKTPVDAAEITRLREELRKIDTEIGRLDGVISTEHKAIVKAIEDIDELEHLVKCPFCQSKGKGWKANIESEYRSVKEVATANKEAFEAQQKKLTEQHRELGDRIDDLEKKRTQAVQIDREIASLESELAQLEQKKQHEATVREAIRKEYDSIGEIAIPNEASITAAQQKKDNLFAEIDRLDNQRTIALRLRQDIQRAAQAELEYRKAAAYVMVIKAVGTKLKEIKAQVVEKVFGGLLEYANAVCPGILKSPLAYHEDQVGRWDGDGRFIPHSTFSGTETAICYVSIAAALSKDSPIRLIILDEMGRLDAENQKLVMKAVGAAQKAGKIDQAIVINTAEVSVAEWSVIALEG